MDKINAAALDQPLPPTVNDMWEKISARLDMNDDKTITWDQVEESTGGEPPLTKEAFDSYLAGQPWLSKEGLTKLREKQAVDAR